MNNCVKIITVSFVLMCSQYGLGMQLQGLTVKGRPTLANKRPNKQPKRSMIKERLMVIKKKSKLLMVKVPPVLDRNFMKIKQY